MLNLQWLEGVSPGSPPAVDLSNPGPAPAPRAPYAAPPGATAGTAANLDYAAPYVDDCPPAVQRKAAPERRAHTPSAAQVKGARETADRESGEAFDSDLRRLARQLFPAATKLEPAAREIEGMNRQIAAKRAEVDKAGSVFEAARLRSELELLEGQKLVRIANARDGGVRSALQAALGELDTITAKAKEVGIRGSDLFLGGNFLSSVMQNIGDFAKILELSAMTELAPLKQRVRALFKDFSVGWGEPQSMKDLEAWEKSEQQMDGPNATLRPLGQHLDAAAAQARHARLLLDVWTPAVKWDLGESVIAIEWHLVEAKELLASMDAGLRKQVAPKLAAVVAEVEAVHEKGKKRTSGASNPGMVALGTAIRRFDDHLYALQAHVTGQSGGAR